MTADHLRVTVRKMIADISQEFGCDGYPRQVFDRIEASLDHVSGGLLRELADLDEKTNGTVVAIVRGRLMLIATGAIQKKLGALELFADVGSGSHTVRPQDAPKAATPAAGPEMEDLPKMLQHRLRAYGRERLELSLAVINQVLESEYARLVARPRSVRMALFPQIVSLHTKADLDQLDGLGTASVRKLEIWLAQHGTRLRRPHESIDAVICNFRPKGWTRTALKRANAVARLEAAE